METPRDRLTARVLVVGAVVLAVAIVVALFAVGVQAGRGGAESSGVPSSPVPSPASSSAPSGATSSAAPDARATPSPVSTASPVPAPADSSSVSPSASAPTLPPPPAAPAAPGEHAWSELFGGECLGAFTSPWEERFLVADCAAAHPAQLVTRGLFGEPAGAPYPGEAELAARLNLLCTAPTVLNTAAAPDTSDLRWQGAFPATEATWAAGDRVYYCFITTASGTPLTGSLVPPA